MVGKDSPVVSVIMNCHNSARYLSQAIDSVFAQSFGNWEIIFLDNCSTDDSAAIARTYDGRLKYFFSKEMISLGAARNLAISKACGKYIAFLDCDDIWLPGKLNAQVAVMEANGSSGMVYTNALFFDGKGRSFNTFVKGAPQGKIFAALLRKYILPMPTIMIRRTALDQIGGWFDERFNMVEDADLFMRMAYYYPVEYIADVLAQRRMHDQSWTAMKKELFPQEEEILLDKFSGMWPSFRTDFANEILHRRAIIQYQYAVLDWEKGWNSKARQRLAPFRTVLRKIWIPYVFSYFPFPVYRTFKKLYKSLTASLMGSVDDQAF